VCAPADAGAIVFFRRAARAYHTDGPRPSRLAKPRRRGNQSQPASRQLQPRQNGTHESYPVIPASRPSRLQSRLRQQSGENRNVNDRTAARCTPRARLRPAPSQVHAARSFVACSRAAPAVGQKKGQPRAPCGRTASPALAVNDGHAAATAPPKAQANAHSQGKLRRTWLVLVSVLVVAYSLQHPVTCLARPGNRPQVAQTPAAGDGLSCCASSRYASRPCGLQSLSVRCAGAGGAGHADADPDKVTNTNFPVRKVTVSPMRRL